MASRTSEKQEMPQVGGFVGFELVLYGIRVMAEQYHEQDSTNYRNTLLKFGQ